MVTGLVHPLGIFVLALGSGFLIPLLFRASAALAAALFMLALAGMTLIAGTGFASLLQGAPAIDIQTAGVAPPFAINLRFGLEESLFVLSVNLAGLLAGWHFLRRLRETPASLLLCIILIMGIDGMIMTRDLFNLFIFIEITALATYGLIGLEGSAGSLAAGFKYIIATSVASALFLLGTIFVYHQTGTLNLDDIVANRQLIGGPIGFAALVLLLTSMLIELKPYPANGWGLDVYETAPGGIASLISVGVSAGVLFALFKMLPLMDGFLTTIAVVGGLTFLVSNLIGLKQTNAQRLLGYSSIGQMGLLALGLALLQQLALPQYLPLIVGGLFVNHLLAKAGLFWLAGLVQRERIEDWSAIAGRPLIVVSFAVCIAALIGLPPFPGFWAKWELVLQLAEAGGYGWIAVVLLGSLLEAAYLFRWFGYALRPGEAPAARIEALRLLPVLIAALLLFIVSYPPARAGLSELLPALLPLGAGALLWLLDGLPGRFKGLLTLAAVAAGGTWLVGELEGLNLIFGVLLVGGGVLVTVASLYRDDVRKGFYPLLAVLLLSLAALLRAHTSLEFFFSWELMTVSSYLIITLGRDAVRPALSYLLFSLGSAFLILTGFAAAYAATGSTELSALGDSGGLTAVVFSLLAAGFVIKLGALGAHIWLPGAYTEADDDFTAILSAVVSKAGVYGLILVAAQLGVRSEIGLDPAYVLGWIGLLTATFGALMAVFQEDVKQLLAYSSMGQLGYIVTGVALMNHLGWVAALYLTVNHSLYKGILFLAIAGVIHRTGTRLMYRMGGLIKNLPFTFFAVMIAIIAMSGVPPLTGFGGKWLLFNAMMDKGWYWLAALAFFSSAVAFLYMFRLLQTVFLGQRKLEHRELREAPLILLVPQLLLIVAILVFSAYPKLLIDPLSAAIEPVFASTLVWEGVALQTRLGYWNAPLIMVIVGAVWAVPLVILGLLSLTMKIQPVKQFNIVYAAERPDRPENTHYAYNFFAHYERALGFLVKPRATAFWVGASEWAHTMAASLRVLYTGNGQTYALFILIFFVVLYFANGGAVS
ncbi:MAG: proton-conducting transporter membrane subunit [Gammaproteobacteria bacterium]|jgi:formate hydrogenlyase subunit 3/multisubunit Na+/H+ antiporter MnhD subunit